MDAEYPRLTADDAARTGTPREHAAPVDDAGPPGIPLNNATHDLQHHSLRAARAQEGRMAFLARASMALGSSLDSAATVQNIARIAVPELADLCIIDLAVDPAAVRRAAVACGDPAPNGAVEALLRQTRLAPDSPQAAALRTGQAQIGDLPSDGPSPWAEEPGEERVMREFGIGAYLVLPLRSRGETLGAVSLLSRQARVYGADEFATAGEFVRRASAAVDNALLYEAAVDARAAAEATRTRLEQSEHFARTIISSVRQGIIVYDRDFRCQVWNRFMEEMTGLAAGDVLGRPALELFPHLRLQGFDALLQRALAGETVQSGDARFNVTRTGRSGWVASVFSPQVGPDGGIIGVVAIVHDITERKQAEEQLAHNAFHDALTGLPNRALFVDRLERLLRHAGRHAGYMFGVAFLDLDRFKIVNDSLGHIVGDELLVSIARRLERCLRQGDTVARLGGDEFAILLDDVADARDASRVVERILLELGRPFHLAGHEVYTTASIGIALSSTGYEKSEDILRDADIAMYRAKLEGRSRYEVFDRNMHQQAVRTLQVETDLRRALERQEFRLFYQPIIGLESGRIVGFEALLRWEHPTAGLVMPGDFVPLAEETGLIVPIGWWVLREACRQMQVWRTQFPERTGLTVSVNLSTRQFMQPDLLDQVDRALEAAGLPGQALQLEITESAVMQQADAVRTMLVALRSRGIQLCIDDFGTGYSSLSYLHAFPVDTLKIDRSFVSQIGIGGTNPRLVEAIVALSRNMGMESVAEGVETEEQLRFLREIGPRFAQGFLFSAARTGDEIEGLLRRDPVW
jgi:diguanylate cyclase (GGDEF)-like protein/PAS domain S-box-containing protein